MSDQAHKLRPSGSGRLKKIGLPILVLGIGFLSFSLLVSTKPQTKPAENRERVWSVKAVPVAYEIYEPRISTFGELRARRQVK